MIDLRSDTITLPTPEMLESMTRAKLGDDMRERDPTVCELEDLAAEKTGTEAALFVTSGTMGNLVALLTHTGRGGEVLTDPLAHLVRNEVGSIAQIAGLFHRPYNAHRGVPDVGALAGMLRPKATANALSTALVCIETSHNSAGGAVIPLKTLAALRDVTEEKGIPVHIDGARLFNAAVSLGVPASHIVQYADSVSFCVSKGLSAPFGSVLCGSGNFIERARLFRRMLGGGMRQAGVVAAAGIVSLTHMIERLGEDHRRARDIAVGLHKIDAGFVDPLQVETNILMVDVSHTSGAAHEWASALATRGVDLRPWSQTQLRLVTHRHIDDSAVARTIAAFSAVHDEMSGL